MDVAYYGCGSGCKYCYVPSSSEKQMLASYEDLDCVVKALEIRRNTGDIVSFCPNTEPFKTKDSADRVLYLLQRLQTDRFHIQISTKEYIDDTLLHKLNTLAQNGTFFINISIPYLEPLLVEPGAADINQRLSNIRRIRSYSHLKCGLYIKPCTQNAMNHIEQYITIINETRPAYVCIGISFDRHVDMPCATLHRKDNAEKVIPAQKNSLMEFAQKIRSRVQCPVVYSSICAIFQSGFSTCSLNLWQYDNNFCYSCNVLSDNNR